MKTSDAQAKKSDTELRQLPKVELHRHLELTMRLTTLCELAPLAGFDVPKDLQAVREKFLVTRPMNDLESVLRKFLVTQKLLSSEATLTRLTREAIEDACAEGIRILELRYAPTFINGGHSHLSFEKIHRAILQGIAACRNLPIAIGLIATIQRILPVAVAESVIDFVIEHKDSFVGVDLADNEEGFEPAPFAKAFARARAAGLKVTIHAGEAPSPEAPRRVRDAIELLGATRIGHGLQIVHSPEVVEFVKRNRVALELCPTSNWLTNAVPTLAQHPFRKLMESGVQVTINSDDPAVFAIDLTNEYQVLQNDQHFTAQEFLNCNDTAAAFSFIPLKEKQKHWPRPIRAELAPWSQ